MTQAVVRLTAARPRKRAVLPLSLSRQPVCGVANEAADSESRAGACAEACADAEEAGEAIVFVGAFMRPGHGYGTGRERGEGRHTGREDHPAPDAARPQPQARPAARATPRPPDRPPAALTPRPPIRPHWQQAPQAPHLAPPRSGFDLEASPAQPPRPDHGASPLTTT